MKMPVYDHRTGNPAYDNRSRRMTKSLHRQLRGVRFSTPRGRRRKKHLKRVEGANLLRLLNQLVLVNQLVLDRQRQDRGARGTVSDTP